MKHSPEYAAWNNMRARCRNPKNHAFKHYGARGIKVLFKSFEDFFAHVGARPEGTSIDRIDNDGHYEPGNVRWVDRKTQMSNRSDNRFITFGGQAKTLTQWADHVGISKGTLWARIAKYGWSFDRAISAPIMGHTEVCKFGAKKRWHDQ